MTELVHSTGTLTDVSQIRNQISELQAALQIAAPGYENLLFYIHKALAADEALVHMLTEEEIGVIVGALSKKKNIVLTNTLMKEKKKSMKSLSEEDL